MEFSAEHPLVVTDKMRREIAGAVAEIDPVLMVRNRELTPAERVQQAASLIEAAERVAVYRLRQREPHLSEDEAYRIIRGGLLSYYRSQGRTPTQEEIRRLPD